MPTTDPAELETEERKHAGAVAFDRLVEATLGQAASNAELTKTVRTTLVVVAACAILSMTLCTLLTFSMHARMEEMRTMLQTILDAMPRAHI